MHCQPRAEAQRPPSLLPVLFLRWGISKQSPTGAQKPLLLGRPVWVGGALALEIVVVKATVTPLLRAPSSLQMVQVCSETREESTLSSILCLSPVLGSY